ncbi:metallophosphoesterase [Pseudolabrys sp. Root1462]|uniref:metallophosphoesterase family protein n=1 Tax=Pseudolabrys sp. Root1462 TaxID=1736466 RepID=UPI000702B93D|nr:metallophosphoesterase family protein [Pseudolabrys sp. Root1462]KQZ01074.1 metallophosphoesterase [Pseudolabrys sp. Root1462]
MLIAFFADIHANRQAFEACLAHARDQGAERTVLLGDYVGYGADPDWVMQRVMDLAADGAALVLGNHDAAVGGSTNGMNIEARVAIEWTRTELGKPARDFLDALPLSRTDGDRLYVHSEASDPKKWIYVTGTLEAANSLSATPAHLTFCGHVHRPALYSLSATAKMTSFTPTAGAAVPLLPGRRWLAVLGAVGQPRDGNPAAAYALYDTGRGELTYVRVPYDVETAAARIRKQGLPVWLADRLFVGK